MTSLTAGGVGCSPPARRVAEENSSVVVAGNCLAADISQLTAETSVPSLDRVPVDGDGAVKLPVLKLQRDKAVKISRYDE